MVLKEILSKAQHTGNLSKEELVFLLTRTADEASAILALANSVRREYVGQAVYLRGLVEFSNICTGNCTYCGLRRENGNVHRYRMPEAEIIETAVKIAENGIGTVVLQSGEDPYFTADRMVSIIKNIKKHTGGAVTLSIGERPFDDYKAMREAGADRFLLRHETANPNLYARLHPGKSLKERVRCLADLRTLGYQVGTGCMVGLPGQTAEDLADDLLFIRSIDADMVGIGPFIPSPDTPLGNVPGGSVDAALRMVALARIVTRDAHIPATTAVGSIDESGREKALMAGANIVMPNYTPLKYRVDYKIYPNKQCINEDPEIYLENRIESIGRRIGKGPGHSLKGAFRKTNT